ncbi:hypothetical protein [Streptomyces sp. NPDC005281]|uniref:hypothetical protein n=1 Tax=Streptomyces sp. NPDC005281 TaxID=3155712 RepID=UPI0033B7AB1E
MAREIRRNSEMWAAVGFYVCASCWRSEDQAPAAVEEKVPAGGYEVPENFLELAAEDNTDEAKTYRKRRCEQYSRTGK